MEQQAKQLRANLKQSAKDEGHRLLSYWLNQVVLPDGSFHGKVDASGHPQPDADRGLILATRLLWTFSRAISSEFMATPEHRKTADKLFDFISNHFWDAEMLGFYWMIDSTGRPVQDYKHIYGQSFAMYALAEYYSVSGSAEALRLAQLTYQLVERYAADLDNGGYQESFSRDWTSADKLTQSPVNRRGDKSMNTHLHLLEAYTRLYQVWPHPELKERLAHVLDVMTMVVYNDNTTHYDLFFHTNWQVSGDEVSYGHDIEGSWLMYEAAEVLGDPDRIERCWELAIRMVDTVLREGVDRDYGVMNEGRGLEIIDGGKDWWPQAEAVVGCVNAYQITDQTSYLESAQHIWSFIEKNLFDLAHGEWFMSVNREGIPNLNRPKVDAWKCPYHNVRACIEVYTRIHEEPGSR